MKQPTHITNNAELLDHRAHNTFTQTEHLCMAVHLPDSKFYSLPAHWWLWTFWSKHFSSVCFWTPLGRSWWSLPGLQSFLGRPSQHGKYYRHQGLMADVTPRTSARFLPASTSSTLVFALLIFIFTDKAGRLCWRGTKMAAILGVAEHCA